MEGIHGLEAGTIRAEHHTAGNQDREGMEVVQIFVRREGRNLAGIGVAEGNREELGQLPGEAGEGPGEEDSVEQIPGQVLGQERVVARPVCTSQHPEYKLIHRTCPI